MKCDSSSFRTVVQGFSLWNLYDDPSDQSQVVVSPPLLGQIFSPFVFRFLTYLVSRISFLFAPVFR